MPFLPFKQSMNGKKRCRSIIVSCGNFVFYFRIQGVIIFVLFDLKSKVYFVGYEKIMGRPHPTLHRSRPIENFATSISSEAAVEPEESLEDDLEDEEEDDESEEEHDESVVEANDEAAEISPKPTVKMSRRRCSVPSNEGHEATSGRPRTVSQSWTSTFSYERTSSESDVDVEKFGGEEEEEEAEESQNVESNVKNFGSVQNFGANGRFSLKPSRESSEFEDGALIFSTETEAEIRLRATSLRALRKKLRDGAIDVSKLGP